MSRQNEVKLGEHFDRFISCQLREGRYCTSDEVIRAGLRLLEAEQAKLDLLRRALIDGEESGRAEYSLESLMQELNGGD